MQHFLFIFNETPCCPATTQQTCPGTEIETGTTFWSPESASCCSRQWCLSVMGYQCNTVSRASPHAPRDHPITAQPAGLFAVSDTQATKAFTYMTNLVSHIIVYRLISCFPISLPPRWLDKTKPLSFHKLPWANTYNTTDILYFVLRRSLFSQIMRRGRKKKSCWSIHSVFLCCNGWSSEGACVFTEIGFITLSWWCHLLFPGRERKVQAGLQWRRMTDSHHVIEHARSMLPLTSLCNMSLLTCTQHPSGNSNHIPSQYSDLSGSCHTLWRQAA